MEESHAKDKNIIKIYPSYFDKNLKVSDGRRVCLNDAIEDPSCEEVYNAIHQILKFECVPEYVSLLTYFYRNITQKTG